ncbi:replication restart DNA helicase PriA [Lachnotalea glycerini]|uniref:Replication restart protein PriA n=1 Tax=Lachnotalea glycerini TaxID=1763509 RepID=A0A255INH0_9FIRM|nr:primosomal protein N' [Lachnotalea glycerini]PXV89501.1 replication restart DNA helicase PriA [Lachnotalea glycerini]RDY32315.1 primosomal protein N' [Lachnotalea glycerini]
MFANIIIDISHEKLDRTFQYAIPLELESKISVGMEVEIPFGNANRLIKGYVLELTKVPEFDISKIKPIHSILKNSVMIEAQLILLAGWMKEQYGGTMIQALKTVIPVKQKMKSKEKRCIRLLLDEDAAKAQLEIYQRKKNTARLRLLSELITTKVLDYELVTNKLNVSSAVIKALKEQGILEVESEQIYRNPVNMQKKNVPEIQLNEKQLYIVDAITKDYRNGVRNTYCIYGITGSGKTEVYMKLIKKAVEQGLQAIVLIPEISLTYQTVMRFYQQFGERVSIINSRLSTGERYDQFERAKNGEIDVMIGPRSALFTPFRKLGFIIIDEEHEGSYKSETVPKYHARETAIARAKMAGASVILGSATPSVDAYYKAKKGEYQLLTLTSRTSQSELPSVYTVDLREELKAGNRSILSRKLRILMEERLSKKEQIMLFINRRGYAGFVSCRACGHVMKCPHCDVSLSSHNNGKLICHYCGYEEKMVKLCPNCGSKYIGGFRAGTQQIEEIVKKEYPNAKILRMDMDTTKSKDGHAKILSAFANGEADILIGTQMIVKGHDFHNVTLVGVLAADLSLYSNDYRCSERTFQLLTQAAGRAGRGTKAGEVVIQTYSPSHYSVLAAEHQDYEEFYNQEMSYRSIAGYPPASNMLAILITSKEEERADNAALLLKQQIDLQMIKGLAAIGPSDCTIAKINDIYKKVIYVKQNEYDKLVMVKNSLEQYINNNDRYKNINVQFDFNPMNTY